MKIQKQKYSHDPDNGQFGDCHRTCVACILGLDKEDVPHPYINGYIDGDKNGWDLINKWMKGKFNLVSFTILYPAEVKLNEVIKSVSIMNVDRPFMLGGKSKKGVGHFVVCANSEIVCDPSGSEIVGPIDDYWWIHVFVPHIEW